MRILLGYLDGYIKTLIFWFPAPNVWQKIWVIQQSKDQH